MGSAGGSRGSGAGQCSGAGSVDCATPWGWRGAPHRGSTGGAAGEGRTDAAEVLPHGAVVLAVVWGRGALRGVAARP